MGWDTAKPGSMTQYSIALLELLLGAIDTGLGHAGASRHFCAGTSTISRWQ